MRMSRNAAIALAAAWFLAPHAAHSQTAVGLRAFGGYNTYAMGDAEDIRRGLRVPSSQFPPLKDGYSLGVGAELAWRPGLSFTLVRSSDGTALVLDYESDWLTPEQARSLLEGWRRALAALVGVAVR